MSELSLLYFKLFALVNMKKMENNLRIQGSTILVSRVLVCESINRKEHFM